MRHGFYLKQDVWWDLGGAEFQNEATLEILNADTVVKHSAKIAIKWTSDGPPEELKRAVLSAGVFRQK